MFGSMLPSISTNRRSTGDFDFDIRSKPFINGTLQTDRMVRASICFSPGTVSE